MSENNIIKPNADVQEHAVTTEATATTNLPVQTQAEEAAGAHDDFDWTIDKRNVAAYSEEEKENCERPTHC